ncbi:MAG: hypothetical protein Q9182_005252 [Xanthomendoza sp. 2 TL-2023]
MLASSENQSTAHTHGPTRHSSLRQVTSTDEPTDPDLAQHATPSRPPTVAPQLTSPTVVQKVLTLGLLDGSMTISAALVDFNVFPKGTISKGSPVAISTASETDLPAHLEFPVGKDNDSLQRKTIPRFGNGSTRHLFVAEPAGPDVTAKYPGVQQIFISSHEATRCGLKIPARVLMSTVSNILFVSSAELALMRPQVNNEDHRASHVEIAFRDEYLSRSDMWRLVVSELAGRIVHKGQRLAFMGTIKIHIRAIYIRGQRVSSALFSASTKPIFRSESARYVLFIQMSKEMWDFDTDGTGEIMFDKVVNGFLPDLFRRWQKINARHLVTIVMFTRLEFKPRECMGPLGLRMAATEQLAIGRPSSQDFYRVVVSDMPSGEWSDILVQLKKEFRVFLRDVSIHTTTEKVTKTVEGSFSSGGDTSHIISGSPSPALRGNILEAVNLASSQFSCDYIDRDLVRTGVSVIVITPGNGLFEVDYKMLATTTDNLIENGIGIDLVCLSRLPLHSVPLFKYQPTPDGLPVVTQPGSERHPMVPSSKLIVDPKSQIEQRLDGTDAGADNTIPHIGASAGLCDIDWRYGIPHWIDVSFWTPSSGNATPMASTGGMGSQLRRKPFTPRARMYQLQMMGVMGNSIDQISLPVLSQAYIRRDRGPAATSLSLSTSPKHNSSSRGTPVLRQLPAGSPQTPSSSVTSRNDFLSMRKYPQYQWMDDYDGILFRHPMQRLAVERPVQDPVRTDVSEKKGEPIDRTTSDHGTSQSLCSNSSGKLSTIAGPEQLSQPVEHWMKGARQTGKTATRPATPSSILHPKAPKLSRQISLGFRGFGVNTSKATASTEMSDDRAEPTITWLPRSVGRPLDLNTGIANSAGLKQQPGQKEPTITSSEINDSSSVAATNIMKSTRPIAIQNSTEIRNSAQDRHSQSPHSSTRRTRQQDEMCVARRGSDPPAMLISQAKLTPEEEVMTPKPPVAPWLTIINPSNPHQTDSDSTSRLGRWQHIFPKKLRASKIKWKSLCSPAAVPLTTEVFPSAKELATGFESSTYKLNSPPDDELLEHPRSRSWLIREMMAFRFSQGFQVVVGSRLAESLYLPKFESFNVFDDDGLFQTDTVIIMTKGSMVHKLSAAAFGHVQVECLSRRPVAPQPTVAGADAPDVYQPMVRTMLAEQYTVQSIAVPSRPSKLDWNLIDSCLAGHQKLDSEKLGDSLRSWRARFVLIPVPPATGARRPLHSQKEVREEETRQEELRLEGIRKMTQIWQRFRHVPPSERRFQASSTRKRKDANPLDIMYQTKNPSEIVAAEKDNLDEDISAGKPVQLLPESELFQRSNLNLHSLAQTIQGEKGIRMMDRRWHLKLHFNCFIGFELASWLLQNFRDVDSREEATELGNELMQGGLFQHVEKRHNFRDGNYFYQVASDYRSARPESRSSWFGSKRADRSVPSTPISEGPGQETAQASGSRSSSIEDGREDPSPTPVEQPRQQLGVALSKSLLYDVDHRKKSYRPELITLHYDRLHNPDNCYHIRIDWLNVTSKFIEDAIVSWAASVERFGLKLVEVPLAEASAITSMHPFRAPALVQLAKTPPSEHPQTLLDATNFGPQPKAETHFYQKEIMDRFEFILDFEAAHDFPADVDVTYSWGRPDYKYPQYVHRSGTLLAQITDEGDFLLLANRLYNNRTPGVPESGRPEETSEREGAGVPNRFGTSRGGNARGSPRVSPFSSPLVHATGEARPLPTNITRLANNDSSTFATPEHIKKQFEDFCANVTALDVFYAEVMKKASAAATPATPFSRAGTPMMESSIPTLGLPPSLLLRDKSPGTEGGKRKARVQVGEKQQPLTKTNKQMASPIPPPIQNDPSASSSSSSAPIQHVPASASASLRDSTIPPNTSTSTSTNPSIPPPIDTSSPEDYRISFRTTDLDAATPHILSRFPNIDPLYLTKIYRGTITPTGLIWLDIGRQDSSPLEFSDLAHLLYCFEVYCQIVCILVRPAGLAFELEMQNALADYRIRVLKLSKWVTWESLLAWHTGFVSTRMAQGQDVVEGWREGREDLAGVLRKRMS